MPAYECSICMEYFDAIHHIPTTFPCGHSCCLRHTLEMLLCHVCRAKLPDVLTPNISLRDLSMEYAEMSKKMRELTASMSMAATPVPSSPEVAPVVAPAAAVEGPEFTVTESVDEIDSALLIVAGEEMSEAVPQLLSKKPRKRAAKKKKATDDASQPQSQFFRPLFLDVMVDVLQAWLGIDHEQYVCMLSALDVACCNRSARPAYLALVRRLSFPITYNTNSWFRSGARQVEYSMMQCSFMRWLQLRQVPVKSICVVRELGDWTNDMDNETFSLPYIEHIHCTLERVDQIEFILRVCPNLHMFTSTPSSEIPTESVWTVISRFSHIKFTHLDIFETIDDENQISAGLKAVGKHLLALACNFRLSTGLCKVIRRYCGQLTQLSARIAPVIPFSHLLDDCKAVSTVHLTFFGGRPEDVCFLLLSNQHLRSFSMDTFSWTTAVTMETFAHIREQFPWLTYCMVNNYYMFDGTSSQPLLRLGVSDDDMTPEMVERYLCAFPEITKLEVLLMSMPCSIAIMTKIGEVMGSVLKDIDFNAYYEAARFSEQDVLALACLCPKLEKLSWRFAKFSESGLEQLRRCCPKLLIFFCTHEQAVEC